jgi:hypothetical protein
VAPHGEAWGRLDAAGAARVVLNGADLGRAVEALLAADRVAAMAQAGWDVATKGPRWRPARSTCSFVPWTGRRWSQGGLMRPPAWWDRDGALPRLLAPLGAAYAAARRCAWPAACRTGRGAGDSASETSTRAGRARRRR